MENSGGLTCLPEDLVTEILTRLPVKTLLICKSVCKHWYNLIKSPSFVSKHYHHEKNQTDFVIQHRAQVANSENVYGAFSVFHGESLTLHKNLDCPYKMTGLYGVVEPVDGLILLIDGKLNLYLWNPAIRESRAIPKLEPNFPSHLIRQFFALGFGLDPVTHDYKAILIEYYWDSVQHPNEDLRKNFGSFVPAIGVYNFTTDAWNLLDPDSAKFPLKVKFYGPTVNLKGDQYWASFSYSTNSGKVFTFDLRNEVFQEVQIPSSSSTQSGSTFGLSLYNDDLAFLTLEVNTRTIHAWVMEVGGCWTKKFAINTLPELSRPLNLWKNNELIFESRNSELVLYNFSEGKVRYTGIRGFKRTIDIFRYKESLVSVNTGPKKAQSRGLLGTLKDFLINKASSIWV